MSDAHLHVARDILQSCPLAANSTGLAGAKGPPPVASSLAVGRWSETLAARQNANGKTISGDPNSRRAERCLVVNAVFRL